MTLCAALAACAGDGGRPVDGEPTATTASSVEWRTYKSDRAGYSIEYPAEWRAKASPGDVDNFSADSGSPIVTVSWGDFGSIRDVITLENMEETQLATIRREWGAEAQVIYRGTYAGSPGILIRYTTREGYSIRQVSFFRDPIMWFITLGTDREPTADEEALFNHMVASIRFDEQE